MRVDIPPVALARRLRRLERQGRYPAALAELSGEWADPGFEPDIEGLSPSEAAEILLRFGSLVGFAGNAATGDGSQERAKDMLLRAHERFSELGDQLKLAETENALACAYTRTGEFREADVWLDQALARDIDPRADARLYSHIVRSMMMLTRRLHGQNVDYCFSVERDFRIKGDPFLSGCLYSNVAVSLKDLGNTAEAIRRLELSRSFFEKCRHRPYLGTVHNNLALAYKDLGKYQPAHASAAAAIAIYKKIPDRRRQGSSLETQAQIFLAERRHEDALSAIDDSIKILRKAEAWDYLAESIATRSKVLVRMGQAADALITLADAIEIARRVSGDDDARQIAADFEAEWQMWKAAVPPSSGAADRLELELPPSLSGYSNYRGVWIHNSHLERIGITPGTLALIVEEEPERGDPAAVMEHKTGMVSCGFYDADFGIICLEDGMGEPTLFDETAVRVLGKIVGICRDERNARGRMVAEPIRSRTSG